MKLERFLWVTNENGSGFLGYAIKQSNNVEMRLDFLLSIIFIKML